MFAMAFDPGVLLARVLGEHGVTHDQAWRQMGYRDAASFSRALTGERPLDERKVQQLPLPLWLAYETKKIQAQIEDWALALLGDRKYVMAKAALRARDEREVG